MHFTPQQHRSLWGKFETLCDPISHSIGQIGASVANGFGGGLVLLFFAFLALAFIGPLLTMIEYSIHVAGVINAQPVAAAHPLGQLLGWSVALLMIALPFLLLGAYLARVQHRNDHPDLYPDDVEL